MTTFDAIADLPLEIESCEFEGLEVTRGSFERATTVIKFNGDGHQGVGEDVVYDVLDHIAQQDAGPPDGLAGKRTFAEFSEALEDDRAVPDAAAARALASTTGAGPSSRRRSTWRCARTGPPSPPPSAASRSR